MLDYIHALNVLHKTESIQIPLIPLASSFVLLILPQNVSMDRLDQHIDKYLLLTTVEFRLYYIGKLEVVSKKISLMKKEQSMGIRLSHQCHDN